jgi:hypothetical protein
VYQSFDKLGFGSRGDELFDTTTTKIVIRKGPKEEEGLALTVFGFHRSERQVRDQWIRESAKSDFPKYRGEILEFAVGADFLKGK